ncbi:MAG: SMC-Scp complex subunit ScpB [Candidatus Saccharimonadales bacterium]
MADAPLEHQLEAILFTASEPLSAARLAEFTGAEPAQVESALELLKARLTGGVRVAHADSSYRLVTAPGAAAVVAKFLQDSSRQELSRPALETLAIVAYKGPLTKAAIESIRGVASETMLRNLIGRGLVAQSGRSSDPGRPPLFAVTHTFLEHFGLTSPSDLPSLPEEGE